MTTPYTDDAEVTRVLLTREMQDIDPYPRQRRLEQLDPGFFEVRSIPGDYDEIVRKRPA